MVGCAFWNASMTCCMCAVLRSRMLTTLMAAVGSVLGTDQPEAPLDDDPPPSSPPEQPESSSADAVAAASPASARRRVIWISGLISCRPFGDLQAGDPTEEVFGESVGVDAGRAPAVGCRGFRALAKVGDHHSAGLTV